MKQKRRPRQKSARTGINWERVKTDLGKPLSKATIAKASGISPHTVAKAWEDEGVKEEKAFEMLESIGIEKPNLYIYDIDGKQPDAPPEIGFVPSGWKFYQEENGKTEQQISHRMIREIVVKTFRVEEPTVGRSGRCKTFDLGALSDENRDMLKFELSRNPAICQKLKGNPFFPEFFYQDFRSNNSYWVIESWEDCIPLKQVVEDESFDLQNVPEIARQLASAIKELHDQEIVARCLTPENVCIRPNGNVLVRDFELATFFGPTNSRKLQESRNCYYAREFDQPDIDWRADLYSWAKIVFYCLSGRRPDADIIANIEKRVENKLNVSKLVLGLLRSCCEEDRDFRKWKTGKNAPKKVDFSHVLADIKDWGVQE